MIYFSLSFFASFLLCLGIVRYTHTHAHLIGDNDFSGAQKFHAYPVPRVGGIAVLLALIVTVPAVWFFERPETALPLWLLLLSVLPVFAGGLAEDILKQGLIRLRLLAMLCSCSLFVAMLGWLVLRTEIGLLDGLLAHRWLAVGVTIAAVMGVINAFNLIDGYNGLSAAVAMIMLSSLAYVAFKVEDRAIMVAALSLIGACLGFMMWNWPRGLIFMGDGGAYTIGFALATLAIAIVFRNPQVSPWYACVLLLYPIVETVFTIQRRLHRKANPGMPDAAHLHQLIYKRMMRWAVGSSCPAERTMRNSMTSPYLWFFASLSVVPATLMWHSTLALQLTACVFVVGYIWLYRSIARFRSPKWLVYRKVSALDKS
ncbi:MraY family glycosyltransferase [Chitinilyticum litopenaei]|uniref:MraY family glycosyltransferase n=1 Tax=Chitinilyticum litopenaei TaxID=1121276 RepID=UPI00040C9A84|nr:glycosyltransferase [Chitinilyticum litopenaei]